MALAPKKLEMGVTIVSASNLPAADVNGKSDPYCWFYRRGRGKNAQEEDGNGKSGKTQPVPKNLNPEWNERFKLDESIRGEELVFAVWDKDTNLLGDSDDFLGRVSLQLGARTTEEEDFAFSVPLLSKNKEAQLTLKFHNVHPPVLVYRKVQEYKEHKAEREQDASKLRAEPIPTPGEYVQQTAPTESRDFDQRVVNLFNEDPVVEEWPSPEDKLVRPDPQVWAAVFLVIALVLCVYASGNPMSCLRPDEHKAPDFQQCLGIEGYGASRESIKLELRSFCWTGCLDMDDEVLLLLVGLALLGQSFVVMLNQGHFSDLFRSTFYFDMWDFMPSDTRAKSQEEDEDEVAVRDEEAGRGFFGAVKERAVRLVRQPVEQKLKAYMTSRVKREFEKVKMSGSRRLSTARSASLGVKMCVMFSWVHTTLIIFFGVSINNVYFRCQQEGDLSIHDADKHLLEPKRLWDVLIPIAIAWLLLMLATSCVFSSKWGVHLTLKVRGFGKMSASRRLREHFDKIDLRDDEYFQGVLSASGEMYVPKSADGFPEQDMLPLAAVKDMMLVGIRCRQVLYEGEEMEYIMENGKVPEEDGQEVTLIFKNRVPSFAHKVKIATKKNFYRVVGIFLLGANCGVLAMAANSCWVCIEGINVPEDMGILTAELDRRLLLLGACGRQGGVGNSTLLGSITLTIALLIQVMIMSLGDYPKKMMTSRADQTAQLTTTLLDFRKTGKVDIDFFENAIMEDQDDSRPPPSVMCHVWVNDKEEVMNGHRSILEPGHKLKLSRQKWRRSDQPRRVRFVRNTEQQRTAMLNGLPVEHGHPTICIEVLDSHGQASQRSLDDALGELESQTQLRSRGSGPQSFSSKQGGSSSSRLRGVQQIVPREFIAGFFHAEVNLGPKLAWEKMSQALVSITQMLAVVDVALFLIGSKSSSLSTCRDIKNDVHCVHWERDSDAANALWHKGQDIDFRPSIGPWLSGIAILLNIAGLFAIRVASKVMPGKPLESPCRTYCSAACDGFVLACTLFTWVFRSIYHGVRNTLCWRRCCGLSKGKSRAKKEDARTGVAYHDLPQSSTDSLAEPGATDSLLPS